MISNLLFLIGIHNIGRRASTPLSVLIESCSNKNIVNYSQQIIIVITNNKQLLDEVFVISRIIKVEVRVISQSRRLRLITLTETLIILDITKTESNNCFIIH